jgi:hypothetical protein
MGRTMPSVRFADFSLKRITSGWATTRTLLNAIHADQARAIAGSTMAIFVTAITVMSSS